MSGFAGVFSAAGKGFSLELREELSRLVNRKRTNLTNRYEDDYLILNKYQINPNKLLRICKKNSHQLI